MKRFSVALFSAFALVLLASCSAGLLYEKYLEIDNKGWKYVEPITFEVEVDDIGKAYDIYVNLRHTNDYPYSNLWLMLYTYPPDEGDVTQQRMELKLAQPDGKWLGNGLGTNITHEIRVRQKFVFPTKGTFAFTLQHDMREQIVPAVSHVGLRVQEAE
ncbi:MAG: gliding motility lipoprotein GldH [Bacteroidia bacterium]